MRPFQTATASARVSFASAVSTVALVRTRSGLSAAMLMQDVLLGFDAIRAVRAVIAKRLGQEAVEA